MATLSRAVPNLQRLKSLGRRYQGIERHVRDLPLLHTLLLRCRTMCATFGCCVSSPFVVEQLRGMCATFHLLHTLFFLFRRRTIEWHARDRLLAKTSAENKEGVFALPWNDQRVATSTMLVSMLLYFTLI